MCLKGNLKTCLMFEQNNTFKLLHQLKGIVLFMRLNYSGQMTFKMLNTKHEPERTILNWFAWNYRRTWLLYTADGVYKMYLKSFIHPTAAVSHSVVLVMSTALVINGFSHQDCLVMSRTTAYLLVIIKSLCGKDRGDILNLHFIQKWEIINSHNVPSTNQLLRIQHEIKKTPANATM